MRVLIVPVRMDRSDRACLEYLAANPNGAYFLDIPNARGLRPMGRNGDHERRLDRLKAAGLVNGANGGIWRITEAGLRALVLSVSLILTLGVPSVRKPLQTRHGTYPASMPAGGPKHDPFCRRSHDFADRHRPG